MIHALGFTNSGYNDFHDKETGDSYEEPLKKVNDIWYLYTPRALKFAQEHFGCPSITGIPLEDGGSTGSKGSHWEKTFIGDEVMQAYKGENMFLTTLTAKVLEDSGFYLSKIF